MVDFRSLSTAFNNVDSNVIWQIMFRYVIPSKFIKLTQNPYESSSRQFVDNCNWKLPDPLQMNIRVRWGTGSPSSFYEPHKQHNMASDYKGLYGIFYKISMEVVKSENSQ